MVQAEVDFILKTEVARSYRNTAWCHINLNLNRCEILKFRIHDANFFYRFRRLPDGTSGLEW